MLWVARGADPARALGSVPTECLKLPADPALAAKVEVGRAAFRTPVLLGGQAARAGINCETCHRDGRTNPDFLFPGVSGAPGTADVTNSLFSTHRGNGIDDPKPIPDLSGPKAQLKVDQAPADEEAGALHPRPDHRGVRRPGADAGGAGGPGRLCPRARPRRLPGQAAPAARRRRS